MKQQHPQHPNKKMSDRKAKYFKGKIEGDFTGVGLWVG
jgi:hypothetical protein